MAKNSSEEEMGKLAANDGDGAAKQKGNAPAIPTTDAPATQNAPSAQPGNATDNVSNTNTPTDKEAATSADASDSDVLTKMYGEGYITASRKGDTQPTYFSKQAWKTLGDGNREGYKQHVSEPPEVSALKDQSTRV